MTTDQAEAQYWLTPAGCAAIGDHIADTDQRHCKVCGTQLGGVS